MAKEPKYIVTAVNKLTGERESVSLPLPHGDALALLMKARRYARREKGTGFYRYRVDRLVEQEGALPFTPPKTTHPECIGCIYVSVCMYFSAPD